MTACEPLSINGIQEVSGSIPLISTILRDVKYRKSPEIARFQDFFGFLPFLISRADWNLTGTGIVSQKRLVERLYRFLLDR